MLKRKKKREIVEKNPSFCIIFQVEDFVGEPEPNLPDDFDVRTATPIDFFKLVFPVSFITYFVDMTNMYAKWKQAQPGVDLDDRWEQTTEAEMLAFLAINILMSINILPSLEMYWSKKMLIGNVGVQQIMTCNSFQKLSSTSMHQTEPVNVHVAIQTKTASTRYGMS
jgi:hypothetical protein